MRKRTWLVFLLVAALLCLAAVMLYNIPPLHERLAWRVDTVRVQLLRALKPPQKQVFIPQGQSTEMVQASPTTISPSATLLPLTPTGTLPPSLNPTQTPTPIPGQVALSGTVHEYQQFNNCGPATLAMALSYWGWQGDQRDVRAALRPNFAKVDDKNVNPLEMTAFIEQSSGLKALSKPGGDLETLKHLIAAGFPVVIEIGIQQHPRDWMGHYLLITGYDDGRGRFTTQDSLVGADMPVKYEQVDKGWRAFNNVYLVLYPPERESEVLSILGSQADATESSRLAAARARQETARLAGRDLFFAWYNLGSNLAEADDFPGAAQAYDQAFAVYADIPEDDRPWRMLWYQIGPYEAYFNLGRYQDVIALGNQALDSAGGPVLEETFYWLGRAREATGDLEKAIYDYRKAVEINPHSTPAQDELERLGAAGL